MPDITQRVNFLKKMHLFRGLKDDQLIQVAREFTELPAFDAQQTVFKQDTKGDALFIIYSGKVSVKYTSNGNVKSSTKILATLIPGDYFGEEALVTKQKRSATIIAEPGTLLLKLGLENFNRLVKILPHLRRNFEIVVKSRRLARRLKFDWLQPNEIIYYLAGRHPITLINWVTPPLVSILVLALLVALLDSVYPRPWLSVFYGILLLINLLWFLWQWVDWSNDYYIVTNERVVRTEKIVALYDSREEAPLSTIISVDVNSSGIIQRQIGLGDVVVRTFTAQITMYDVANPDQVESMVQEYWNRSKEKINTTEKGAIKKALLNKINPPPPKAIEEVVAAPLPKPESYAPSIYQQLFANFLKVRFEDSNVVTYRKHWFVLIRDTLKEFALTIILIAAPFIWHAYSGFWLPVSGWSILLVALLAVLGWWLYDYVDWVNDVYKVTPEQIIDINKKPLSKENRKSASLDNIMSTASERRGILGLLLNYGVVKIKVGSDLFDFTDVFDPPQVEQDIVRRVGARKLKKAEAEKVAEAERMGNWLANYHQISNELRNNEQSKTDKTK